MASTTTINSWMDQLAASILPSTTIPNRIKTKKQLDTFRRRVRSHPFARTNQFEVENRLDGLQEKFQILSRDDLSDDLHERRIELRGNQVRWLPEALDLLLHLSNDPFQRTAIRVRNNVEWGHITPIPVDWIDPENYGPEVKEDPIWQRPDWSAYSSDEDLQEPSTAQTSPHSVRPHPQTDNGFSTTASSLLFSDKTTEWEDVAFKLVSAQLSGQIDTDTVVDERQFIREALLLVQGYPTTLFYQDARGAWMVHKRVLLRGVSPSVLSRVLKPVYELRHQVHTIRTWIHSSVAVCYLQLIRDECEKVLNAFLSVVNDFAYQTMRPQPMEVVSLLDTLEGLEQQAASLRIIHSYVLRTRLKDSVACLEVLNECVCQHHYCGDAIGLAVLTPMFLKSFALYMGPILVWIEDGSLTPGVEWLFIHQTSDRTDPSALWTTRYGLDIEGPHRPPSFLTPFARDIFTCGKTSAFISMLMNQSRRESMTRDASNITRDIELVTQNPLVSFPAATTSVIENYVTSALSRQTLFLKEFLVSKCGLNQALDAFDLLYLCSNGMVVDHIERKIFRRIDRCEDNWNDRFLIANMLEDTHRNFRCIDLESILVRSTHTSSRSMRSRRRSVKIMSALAIEYTLPWPITNIISRKAMASYCQVSLHLAQIRRAKHVLERIAYPAVFGNPVSADAIDQKRAQALSFMLINFTNTLYDHFSICVIGQLTAKMRIDLHTGQTIDDMISAHRSYISQLQHLCLLNQNLKLLRDTLIGLLDMCIRFADLVSTNSVGGNGSTLGELQSNHDNDGRMYHGRKSRSGLNNMKDENDDDDDFETSSFKSANSQSWRKRRQARHQRAQERKANRSGQQPTRDDDVLPSSSSSSLSSSIPNADDSESEDDLRVQTQAMPVHQSTRAYEHDIDDNIDTDSSADGEGEGYSSFIVLEENTTPSMEIQKLQTQFQRQLDFFVAGLNGVSNASTTANGPTGTADSHVTVGVDEMRILAERLDWRRYSKS